MRIIARWGALTLLLTPVGAWAFGFGGIELRSALQRPFRAQIEISVAPDEAQSLVVDIADANTYELYGLERPSVLSRLDFSVGRNELGRDVVWVSSVEPIDNPFLILLVEATWSSGRSLREYTVLLDLPAVLPGPAGAESAQPPVRGAGGPAITRPLPEADLDPDSLFELEPDSASEFVSEPAAEIEVEVIPVGEPEPEPERLPVAVDETPLVVGEVPAADSAPVSFRPRAEGGNYGPVLRGETLWGIATEYRPDGVTMNQMLLAIYEANPDAFIDNMNLLLVGATLRIPDLAQLEATTAAAATAAALRHTEEWEAWKTQRQGGPPPRPAVADAGSAAEDRLRPDASIPTAAQDQPESQNRLTLLPLLEELQSAATAGDAATPEPEPEPEPATAALADSPEPSGAAAADAADDRRLLAVESQELSDLQDLQERLEAGADAETEAVLGAAEADAPVVDPGVDLEPVFADETPENLTPAEPDTPAADATEPAADAAVDAADEPASARATNQVSVPVAEPSLISRVVDWFSSSIITVGVGVVALLLLGLWFLRRRDVVASGEAGADAWDELETPLGTDSGGIDVQVSAPVREPTPAAAEAPTERTDTFALPENVEDFKLPGEEAAAGGAATTEQAIVNLDQGDPMAEADFHMAYGLYDQAADLVASALQADPGNRALKLKLLEVFFVWGNKDAFLKAAQDLRKQMGGAADGDWDKVVIMGKQICPDEAIFSEATAGAGSVDLTLDAGQDDDAVLDMAFDEVAAGATDVSDSAAGDADFGGDLDFDLNLGDQEDTGVDLDVGGDGDAGMNLDIDVGDQSEVGDLDVFVEPTSVLDRDFGEEAIAGGADDDALDILDIGEQTTADIEDALLGDDMGAVAVSDDGDTVTELDLDDLGLDAANIDDVTGGDFGDAATMEAEADDELFTIGEATSVLDGGDDDDSDLSGISATFISDDDDDDATGQSQTVAGLDLDLDDLSVALDGAAADDDTATGLAMAGTEEEFAVDFTLGSDDGGGADFDADDSEAMSEVGTKLDLARAYIDMGDPDGARSILDEVLQEGDADQRQDAQSLIDVLSA